MKIYKPKYTTKDGQRREGSKWYLDFTDHLQVRRRLTAFKNARASEAFGRRVEELVTIRASGDTLNTAILTWLETLPETLLSKFVSWGLLDSHRATISKRLIEHLADFKKSLLADGCTDRHATQKCNRAKKILVDDCGFVTFADIRASKVKLAIDQVKRTVRKKVDGALQDVELGPATGQTKTHYTRDLRAFTAWAFLDGRTMSDPLALLKRDSQKKKSKAAKTQIRSFKRRALSPLEIGQLLTATEAAGLRYGMTGLQRAAAYRLALETGLRAGEIRSLKPCDVDFTERFVRVVAINTKNGEEAILPLRKDLCETLKGIAANKHPEASLFKLPGKPAEMLRKDLGAAEIDPEDEGKGRVDFHGLRHCFGSLLAASGVHPKIAQDLMRHSDINLTMSRYTHTLLGQSAKAVEALPDFYSIQAKAEAKRTGTDDGPVDCIGEKIETSGPDVTGKTYDASLTKSTHKPGSSRTNTDANRCSGQGSGIGILSQKRGFCAKKGKANGRNRTDNRRFTKPGLKTHKLFIIKRLRLSQKAAWPLAWPFRCRHALSLAI